MKTLFKPNRILSLGFVLAVLFSAPASAQTSDQIEAALGVTDPPLSVSQQIQDLIPRFYAQREFNPAWDTDAKTNELFQALKNGVSQGFAPEDFGTSALQDLFAAAQLGSDQDKAAFDISATYTAFTLLHHLFFGKVDAAALDDNWNFTKPVLQEDPAAVLNAYLSGKGFSTLVEDVTLRQPQYSDLISALATYRDIQASGGWPQVPDSEPLKPGDTHPAVGLLRQRLAREGAESAPAPLADPNTYDDLLVDSVTAFQSRHGLEADGVIGAKTFVSLNAPVEDRINKLRLSLERARWIMRDLDDAFVLVNIAGARTYLVRENGTLWTTRSITGSQYRKTPVFRDEISYMEFNPTWTVPASIFRKDKLDRIRQDISYLDRNGYRVRNSAGEFVPATSVNWQAGNPSVTLVQMPGSNNALGRVKFMFPNDHAVYLHDTNDKALFDRNERNLSSGCVRLEHPYEFASLLMEGDLDWSLERMNGILESGKTTRIDLPEPMPVLLTYWTAWVEEGIVHFREDPYERDAAILGALERR